MYDSTPLLGREVVRRNKAIVVLMYVESEKYVRENDEQ
jgi:hypothetical protein